LSLKEMDLSNWKTKYKNIINEIVEGIKERMDMRGNMKF
jgi:hypothetical protein